MKAIWVVNILYINDAMAKIFEYDSPHEGIGQGCGTSYTKISNDRKVFLKKLLRETVMLKILSLNSLPKPASTKNAIVTAVLHLGIT